MEVITMLFEDQEGKLWHQEEVFELSPHEILEKGFHLFNERLEFAG